VSSTLAHCRSAAATSSRYEYIPFAFIEDIPDLTPSSQDDGLHRQDRRGTEETCKDAGVAVSGTKAVTIARLQANEQMKTTTQATTQTVMIKPEKLTGAGSRSVSPIKDRETSLARQHALDMTLLPIPDWSDCHPRAIKCAHVLKVSLDFIERDMKLPVSDEVGIALEPVLRLYTALGTYTRHIARQKMLSGNSAHYNTNLHRFMSERVEEMINEFPDRFRDVSI